MELLLDAVEARVLGCLIEKERTTPEYYPLTKNSLVAACNQKSNRDPEMSLTEIRVDAALDSLRYKHNLVATVTQANSRVLKYKHQLLTHFSFSPEEAAVVCELLLRGPQTAGELRTHTKRIVEMASPAKVKEVLDSLMHWGEIALVKRLPPARGMREERYAHLFCGEPQLDDSDAVLPEASVPLPVDDPRLVALDEKVANLEARLAAIEQALL
ncbi:MAG: YceH family protein [Kiritimatiellia bacterium]